MFNKNYEENDKKKLLKSWLLKEIIEQDEKIEQLLLNLKKIMSIDQYNLFLYDNITDQLNNIDEVKTFIRTWYAADHQTIAALDMQHRLVMEKRKDIEKKHRRVALTLDIVLEMTFSFYLFVLYTLHPFERIYFESIYNVY
jgi:hypothetical protein